MSSPLPSRSRRKRKKSLLPKIILCCIAFMLLVIGGLGLYQARRFFPYPPIFAILGIENWQVWEFHDYFGLDPNEISVVIEDQRLRDLAQPPVMINNEIYLPASFVREHIDPFIFWDEGAQSLFVSTDTEIIRLPGSQMVPLNFLQERYSDNFSLEHHPEHNIVVISEIYGMVRASLTTRRTAIRYLPNNTAFISKRLERDTLVTIYNTVGDFVRVRSQEGLLGYVPASDLEFSVPWQAAIAPPPQPLHPSPRINLSWEMITAPQGNITAMNNPLPEGLTVISPTWFNFDPYNLDGTIISFASREYVDWAHSQGVKVWAKAFDSNRDISHAILTNYRARQFAITQLIQFVQVYNLDGININFEHVRSTDGGYYLQFLRELAVEMRRIGSTLSVATFVPAPWFSHYHHKLVGQTVDFVAIMTYDEHYSGSVEPGPVASLSFVDHFISQTLELIPREKVLMGLPLYNRLWHVASDGSHTISNTGMARPWSLVEEWGITPEWDAIVGSYYANFEGEYTTYRIWIECDRSIAEKMNIFTEHNLAGVASWRRGLETPGVWAAIATQL